MNYPFRYDKAKVGDKVFALTMDEKNNFQVEEVTIDKIQDNSYHVEVDKKWQF